MEIPEFTDYSCYEEHASNASKMNGMERIPPNFFHNPVAYNGRTSSIILSGTNVPRPKGVYLDAKGSPELQACRKLDYELEMGVFVSKPLPWGSRISPDEAWEEHIFGYVLLNDWSARDIQAYESFPLGPFNSKSFATSIGSWVILPEALEPFSTRPLHQNPGDVLPHLQHKSLERTTYDIKIDCHLNRRGKAGVKVSTTNFAHSYFSVGQILSHRALSGCGLRTGELFALGTMSSTADVRPDESVGHHACLWELSNDGRSEVPIVGGTWLEDGDRVTFTAWAGNGDGTRIGFGNLTAEIIPAF